jgi:hypothetical protein
MWYRLLIFSIFFIGAAPQLSSAQTALMNKNILNSFARTVRSSHYVCLSCKRVFAIGQERDGLAYRVICQSGLEYKVILTPQSAMIIEPTNHY